MKYETTICAVTGKEFALVPVGEVPTCVTVDEFSNHVHAWRFDYEIQGSFGTYLMEKYPNGMRIVPNPQHEK
jgi:hypothetical protein